MKISVCIPVYNVEQHIEKCINSVLQQSLQDFEIIIVNDASLDHSMEKIMSYVSKDSRIRVYNNLRNMGLMWTRREGYKRAVGDYIVFLDSDDTLPTNALEILYKAIHNTNYDIVCGQIRYITNNSSSLDKYPNKLVYGTDSASAIKSTLRWEITHNLCGKIYSRKLLQSHHYDTYADVVNAEDAILFYQVLSNVETIYAIPDVVYNYYLDVDSSTNVELGQKALNGIFLWQKKRYEIINKSYQPLLEDLYVSMMLYLTGLAPSLNSRRLINGYLQKYQIPFRVNLINILKYTPMKKVAKSIISYYLCGVVKKLRYYRLRHE